MYFSQKAASSTDGKRTRVSESEPLTAVQSLSTVGLDGILYFLGYKDSYIDDKQFKL